MVTRKLTRLTNYVRFQGIVANHEFSWWCARECCDEPDRLKQKLIEQGIIKKLTDEQLKALGAQDNKEDYFYYCGPHPILNNKHKYEMIGVNVF